MKLPTADGELELTNDHITAFGAKYPHTDVRAELGKMLLWLEKNRATRWKLPWRAIDKWLTKAETVNKNRRAGRVTGTNIVAWWTDNGATLEKAKELGLNLRPGEEWSDLRRRIKEKIA